MKLITLLLFTSHLIIGQNFMTISGKVLDSESKSPLSYAHIGILGQSIGTVSNSNGAFEFHIPTDLISDTLIASYVSYDVYHEVISIIEEQLELIIYLTKRPIALDEIVLYEKKISAKEIVQNAFDKIEENFDSEPFILEGFFRDWSIAEFVDNAKENHATLLEAAISIFDYGYLTNSKKRRENVYLNEIRRSQKGDNWEYTWNNLDALLKQNFVHHPRSRGNVDLLKGPLDFPNDLHYSIENIIGNTDDITYIIKAVSQNNQDYPVTYIMIICGSVSFEEFKKNIDISPSPPRILSTM